MTFPSSKHFGGTLHKWHKQLQPQGPQPKPIPSEFCLKVPWHLDGSKFKRKRPPALLAQIHCVFGFGVLGAQGFGERLLGGFEGPIIGASTRAPCFSINPDVLTCPSTPQEPPSRGPTIAFWGWSEGDSALWAGFIGNQQKPGPESVSRVPSESRKTLNR